MASSLNKGLILHYDFADANTDSGKLRDKSAYGNDGTLQNSPDIGKNSLLGEAYKFDGSDSGPYVEVGQVQDAYSTFTVNSWVRLDEDKTKSHILSGDGTSIRHFQFRYNSPNWEFLWFDSSDMARNVTVDGTSDVGRWTMVTAAHTGSEGRFYVNGSLETSLQQDISVRNPKLEIASSERAIETLNGAISDARIYNRVLSESEINRLYQQRSSNELRAQLGSGSAGTVAHWPLDDSDFTAEDKVGNNDGTLQGGVTTGVQSPIGRGMKFDGTNNTSVDTSGTGYGQKIADTNEFTISYWINYDELKNYAVPFGNVLGGANELWTEPWRDSNAGVSARFIDDSGSQVLLETSYFVEANKWYLATFTWDGDDLKAYIDADEKGSVNSSGSVVNPHDYFFIGTGNENEGATIKGTISDARLYNRALSDSEIRSIYDQGLPVPESGLEGWWTMDDTDTSSDTVTDQSGNGNTGTLIGPVSSGSGGKIAEAFDFDGTGSGVDTSIQSLTPPLTLSAWVNPDQSSQTGEIISNFNSSSDDLYVRQSGSGWEWAHDAGGGVTDTFGSNAVQGEWQLVTLVLDDTNLIGYVDGEEQGRASDTVITTVDNGNNFHIGIAGDQATNPFDGQIDDAKVYFRALSGSEVRKLYHSTAPYYKSEVDGVSARNVSVRGIRNTPTLIRSLQVFSDFENWSANENLDNRFQRKSGISEWQSFGTLNEETSNPLIGQKSGLFDPTNDSYFSISDQDAISIDPNQDFATVVWARREDSNADYPILTKDDGIEEYELEFQDGGAITWRTGGQQVFNNNYDPGEDVMIVAFYDSTSSEIGISVNLDSISSAGITSIPNNSASVSMGFLEPDDSVFNGAIDHVAIAKGSEALQWRDEREWLYNNGNGRTWNEIKQYKG